MVYQRNEYDWCVLNKITDDKQCTILWNVEDLKTSHVDPAVISSILSDIDVEYGKISKITITQVKVYKYLGVTIDYSLPSKVIFLVLHNNNNNNIHHYHKSLSACLIPNGNCLH